MTTQTKTKASTAWRREPGDDPGLGCVYVLKERDDYEVRPAIHDYTSRRFVAPWRRYGWNVWHYDERNGWHVIDWDLHLDGAKLIALDRSRGGA